VEGQDQVHALLSEIAALQMRYLRPLQRLHQDLIRKVCKDSFMDVMQKTNDWNCKSVARSDLVKLLDRLKRIAA